MFKSVATAGKEHPLEMHIVNFVHNSTLPGCGAGGCATVVGILFELAEDDAAVKNRFINTVFSAMSSFENVSCAGRQQHMRKGAVCSSAGSVGRHVPNKQDQVAQHLVWQEPTEPVIFEKG